MAARKFFYVCAELLCLVLAFHLGAVTGHAQTDGTIEGAALTFTGAGIGVRASGVVNRVLYQMNDNGVTRAFSPPIPGSQPIIDTEPTYGDVLLANGEVLSNNGADWHVVGSIFPGPVPAMRTSWGQLKARYR